MNDIIKFGGGIRRDGRDWILLFFVWNPTLLHVLPVFDMQNLDHEFTACIGWLFLNFVFNLKKGVSED